MAPVTMSVAPSHDSANPFIRTWRSTGGGWVARTITSALLLSLTIVLFMMIVGWGLVALISLFVWALMRSPWGRVLKSIREDEDAARALGKNVLSFKMQSLVLGGVIGSIGGLWLSAQKQSAQTGEFATTLTFFAFTIIVLGGLGRVIGPIVGTVIFFFVIQFVDNVLQQATVTDSVPEWIVDTSNFAVVKYIVAGLMLSMLVIFRPQGIFGDKREQVFDVR